MVSTGEERKRGNCVLICVSVWLERCRKRVSFLADDSFKIYEALHLK